MPPRVTWTRWPQRYRWPVTAEQTAANAEQLVLQLDAEAKLAASIKAHARRPRVAAPVTRAAALDKLEREGAALLLEVDDPPSSTATWVVRIYYQSEGGDLVACDFPGFTAVQAANLESKCRGLLPSCGGKTEQRPPKRGKPTAITRCGRCLDCGSQAGDAQSWNARVTRRNPFSEAPPILHGARVVQMPPAPDRDNPAQPVVSDDTDGNYPSDIGNPADGLGSSEGVSPATTLRTAAA